MSKIPLPEYISLKDWTDQLFSLYEADFLPILVAENEWLAWGEIVASCSSFEKAKVPPPTEIGSKDKDAWKTWARTVIELMPE